MTENFLSNVDELNKQNGNQPINTKPLYKCYGIDCISKFIFAIDVNSFKDTSEWTQLAKVVGDPNIFQALCQVNVFKSNFYFQSIQ